jgi:hypothetical protein
MGGMKNPKVKELFKVMSEGNVMDPQDYRNLFFANKFNLPGDTDNYGLIEYYLKEHKKILLEENSCYTVPHMMENKDMMGIFYDMARFCIGFCKSEISMISTVQIQKTAITDKDSYYVAPECREINGKKCVKLIMVIKKNNKHGSPAFEMRFGPRNSSIFLPYSSSFGTIVDEKFQEISINLAKNAKRGKRSSVPLDECFLISIDFLPDATNADRYQATIVKQDPRNPLKPVLKLAKSAGSSGKEKLMGMFNNFSNQQQAATATETPEATVEEDIAVCKNIKNCELDTDNDDE